MTAQQRTSLDAFEAQQALQAARDASSASYDTDTVLKALVQVIVDAINDKLVAEINQTRTVIKSIHTGGAVATALPDVSEVTYAQARDAIRSRVQELTPGEETAANPPAEEEFPGGGGGGRVR
jgi:hypothetical protein